MQIIDVDIKDMERARRRTRSRSSETVQLVEAIESLGQNEARGVAIADGLPEKKLRSRLAYAAKIAGRRLDVASDGKKVMFTLSENQRRRRKRRAG